MTNEKKIKSLWYNFCTEKDCGGHTHCEFCPKAQVHPQLLEMAEWKEKQMIEKMENFVKGLYLPAYPYQDRENSELIEDIKQAMKGE